MLGIKDLSETAQSILLKLTYTFLSKALTAYLMNALQFLKVIKSAWVIKMHVIDFESKSILAAKFVTSLEDLIKEFYYFLKKAVRN